jgi:hypothetical protein
LSQITIPLSTTAPGRLSRLLAACR